MKKKTLDVLEEQAIIGFSGKINFLRSERRELIGTIIFISGNIANAKMSKLFGLKALLNLLTKIELLEDYEIIVEPELIDISEHKIDIPLKVLEKKVDENYNLYKDSVVNKPDDKLNLLIKPTFLRSNQNLTPQEYSLLCTISDYSVVEDIYAYNEMLDHDITSALVKLRHKDALKVVK